VYLGLPQRARPYVGMAVLMPNITKRIALGPGLCYKVGESVAHMQRPVKMVMIDTKMYLQMM
jgi:hypothetical protein